MNNLPKFKDGDVLCFFGDSITANGLWMAEIYQELRKQAKIKCYNCGVAGASAYISMPRIYSHCLIHCPHYVVVMFGINDIFREIYADDCDDPNKEQIKADAIARYQQSYEWIISEIVNHGATPIMCIPVPYDDVSDVHSKNLNCRKGLDACAKVVSNIHKKYGGYLIDFNSVMTQMLGKEDIMSPDRVHPTPYGHHVMAQTFLHQLNVIDKPQFEVPFKMEAWNEERYGAERIFENINFVEYCALANIYKEGKLTIKEKKELVKEKFSGPAFDTYLQNIDFKDKLMAEVIRLTI